LPAQSGGNKIIVFQAIKGLSASIAIQWIEQMICVGTNLGQALAQYMKAVRLEIQNRKSLARPADTRLAVLVGEDQILLRAVESAEKGQEFQTLVRDTASLCHPEGPARASSSKLARQVAEFFRLSGIYCDLFDGRGVQPEEVLPRFHAAFEAETQTVTYYAPIEWVYFGKEAVRFGEFEIRRLTTAEMETIFRDRIHRVFYPWARVNVDELVGYWCLIARETVPVDPPGRTIFRINARVDPHRPRFYAPIDRALSLLALGDWSSRRSMPADKAGTPDALNTSEWPLPELVPFAVTVSDYHLDWPRRAPDTSLLNRIEETDPQTGEVWDQPNYQIHWDVPRADEFERLLASVCQALEGIQPQGHQWAFFQVALHFLGKAFTSAGIESLLWSMIAIDALVGEDEHGTKARLSARVGRILGEPQREKCKALYGIRSDLVHGNAEFKSAVHLGHVGIAREMARLAALWMLRYLEYVAAAAKRSSSAVPGRADLMAILDGNVAARQRHAVIAEALPKTFPRVKAWLEPPKWHD